MSTFRHQSPMGFNANITHVSNNASHMDFHEKQKEFIKDVNARIKDQGESIEEYIKLVDSKLAELNARMNKYRNDRVALKAETDKRIALLAARIAGDEAEVARLEEVIEAQRAEH